MENNGNDIGKAVPQLNQMQVQIMPGDKFVLLRIPAGSAELGIFTSDGLSASESIAILTGTINAICQTELNKKEPSRIHLPWKR